MTCETCGFRRDLWTDGDLRTTLDAASALVHAAMDGAPRDVQAEMTKLLAGIPEGDVHALMHALDAAGRVRHAGTTAVTGLVAQVSASGGGVPKLPLTRVRIGYGGLEGDTQQNRRHHGRPWQAVCLWSAELVEELQAEGHPIAFGSAGENVTVRGLDWPQLSPGLRLQVGTAVLQLSSYAVPCVKLKGFFADADFSRLSQDKHPGRSRVYASVLVPGVVQPGDAVVVEPSFAREVQLTF